MKKLFFLIPLFIISLMASATVPSTDFASPYSCTADAAVLSGTAPAGKFYLQSASDPHYITWSDIKMLDVNPEDGYTAVATWTINATRACYVSVTLDLGPAISTNKHIFEVKILDAEGTEMGAVREGPAYTGDGFTLADDEKDLSGKIIIPAAGEYTIELRNNRDWGKGSVKNVILTYAGAAPVTDFASPGYSCSADDAVLNSISNLSLYTDTDPHYIVCNECAYNATLATWTIYATRACYISASLDFGPKISSNKHIFEVKIKDANGSEMGVVAEGEADPSGDTEQNQEFDQVKTINGNIRIPAVGIYTVELRNIRGYGKGSVKNVILTYAGGATQDIPGTITLSDAILSSRAFIDGTGLHFIDNDHLGYISGEYAKWNIAVAADGVYKFTANCNTTGESYSNLTIQVKQDGVEKHTYTPQYDYTGEKVINSPEWFLEAGNYELILSNPKNHSNGYLTSLSASETSNVLVVDENATDMQYIKDQNANSRKPVLKRSFTANMYNTVVFPFNGVTNAELESIFGAGYELLEISSATVDGDVLVLEFAAVDLSSSTYGRPYLIKPTKNVANPLFSSKTIYASTSHLTQSGEAADFIGSFVKTSVPAGENNLFLGSGNKLYFSSEATPIKGMRAYFEVDPSAGAPARARIVANEQVVTDVELLNGKLPETFGSSKVGKFINNGQLIIVKDGVYYNAFGIKVK